LMCYRTKDRRFLYTNSGIYAQTLFVAISEMPVVA
jgi:hypothetical protein